MHSKLTVAVPAMLLTVACASGGPAPDASQPAASASAGVARTLVTTLVPTNASGNRIAGRIRLVPTATQGELTAEIELRGGGYQNKYAWEVRSGQCGDNSQALGTIMAYPLIETRADGMAQLKRPIRLAIPDGQVHHVVVFPSATNRSTVVSCGVLSSET